MGRVWCGEREEGGDEGVGTGEGCRVLHGDPSPQTRRMLVHACMGTDRHHGLDGQLAGAASRVQGCPGDGRMGTAQDQPAETGGSPT